LSEVRIISLRKAKIWMTQSTFYSP